jgi:hypothetical protein
MSDVVEVYADELVEIVERAMDRIPLEEQERFFLYFLDKIPVKIRHEWLTWRANRLLAKP